MCFDFEQFDCGHLQRVRSRKCTSPTSRSGFLRKLVCVSKPCNRFAGAVRRHKLCPSCRARAQNKSLSVSKPQRQQEDRFQYRLRRPQQQRQRQQPQQPSPQTFSTATTAAPATELDNLFQQMANSGRKGFSDRVSEFTSYSNTSMSWDQTGLAPVTPPAPLASTRTKPEQSGVTPSNLARLDARNLEPPRPASSVYSELPQPFGGPAASTVNPAGAASQRVPEYKQCFDKYHRLQDGSDDSYTDESVHTLGSGTPPTMVTKADKQASAQKMFDNNNSRGRTPAEPLFAQGGEQYEPVSSDVSTTCTEWPAVDLTNAFPPRDTDKGRAKEHGLGPRDARSDARRKERLRYGDAPLHVVGHYDDLFTNGTAKNETNEGSERSRDGPGESNVKHRHQDDRKDEQHRGEKDARMDDGGPGQERKGDGSRRRRTSSERAFSSRHHGSSRHHSSSRHHKHRSPSDRRHRSHHSSPSGRRRRRSSSGHGPRRDRHGSPSGHGKHSSSSRHHGESSSRHPNHRRHESSDNHHHERPSHRRHRSHDDHGHSSSRGRHHQRSEGESRGRSHRRTRSTSSTREVLRSIWSSISGKPSKSRSKPPSAMSINHPGLKGQGVRRKSSPEVRSGRSTAHGSRREPPNTFAQKYPHMMQDQDKGAKSPVAPSPTFQSFLRKSDDKSMPSPKTGKSSRKGSNASAEFKATLNQLGRDFMGKLHLAPGTETDMSFKCNDAAHIEAEPRRGNAEQAPQKPVYHDEHRNGNWI